MKKISIAIILCLCAFTQVHAQKIIDEIVAVVGNEVVLYSDVESQLSQMKDLTLDKEPEARCMVIDQLMQRKLLLSRAKYDSLKVTDEQVNTELDRRMQFFIDQFGGNVQALEKFYNKSVAQLKNDFRDPIREQLLEEQMQNKVVSDVDVTPQDVKKFYAELPKDSLPYYNAELEIGQIVVVPTPSKFQRDSAIHLLRRIRQQIISGQKKFSTMAILYSEDEGSALNGGMMEMQRADNFVPEFAAAVLSLKKDSISDVVESKFGFHIIKLVDRKGDMVQAAHILRHPKVTDIEVNQTQKMLDSLRTVIKKDSITFENAAYKYSQDQDTKNRGGMMVDLKTNSSHIPTDQLDAGLFSIVDKLKVGEISDPVYFKNAEGKDAYRMVYLKSRTLPHKANLKDDYPKIKELAQASKKQEKLNDWAKKYIGLTYIRVNANYNYCHSLDRWKKGASSSLGSK
jgi:peptidyl-prolyl cis-trans isomerase SurA